jgi:hypothetical protein
MLLVTLLINSRLKGSKQHTTIYKRKLQKPRNIIERQSFTLSLLNALTLPAHIQQSPLKRKPAMVRPDRQTCSEGKRTKNKNPWAWLFTTSTAQVMFSKVAINALLKRRLASTSLALQAR